MMYSEYSKSKRLSATMAARVRREGRNQLLLFNGYRASVVQDEKSYRDSGGDEGTTT